MEQHGFPTRPRPPVNLPPIARSRSRSAALQRGHELLQEMDLREVEAGGVEAVGSKETPSDPPAEGGGDDHPHAAVPALRVCGQLAKWTGNSTGCQGQVGISSCIYLEALAGEMASSCLELRNEGGTAVFYSWEKLHGSSSISHLLPPRKQVSFYFNRSSAVILPGDTLQVDLVFKSVTPGLHTEAWQLKTHPRLLQGASLQVALMGLAVDQDKSAELRRHLETRLEETVAENLCRSLLYEIVEGLQIPERPRTLGEFLRESPTNEETGSEPMEPADRNLLFGADLDVASCHSGETSDQQ